jgi:TolB-like protein/DNA-binding winged helix-turn-helix (wHTH) protein/Tfp pilus assembly protein PilF
MPENQPATIAYFGSFQLDLVSGELRKHGLKLKLGEQPFQILKLLLERSGQLVSREELHTQLWPSDTFVDFDHGLNSAIRRLREILSDTQEHAHWVETVPRRGYRFVGVVTLKLQPRKLEQPNAQTEVVASPAEVIDSETTQKSDQTALFARKWNPARVGAAFGLAVVASLAVWGARRWESRRNVSSAAPLRTLAVLPLENLSGDSAKEYFADGITDELITELAKNRRLQVISRTSVMQYKNVRRPLREVAGELGADAVVEGTVALNGTKVRVAVQLIRAATDSHLWAQSYERDLGDTIALQTELARNIANELKATVLPSESRSRTISPEAHDYYLKGRYAWFSGNGARAKEFFEKARDLQPDYAEAYSGLAYYYGGNAVTGDLDPRQAMPESERYARKSVELDDSLADAHNAMAAIDLFYHWDWKKAEEQELRAIELNPSFAEAYHVLAYILMAQNRTEDAIAAQRKASQLGPFERPWAFGYILGCAERYREAETELKHELEMAPANFGVRARLASVLRIQGKEKEAAMELAEGERRIGHADQAAEIEKAFAEGGDAAVQQLGLKSLEARAKREYVSPMEFAYAYARLRDRDKTMEWLEKAYQERSPRLVRLTMEPDLKSMEKDPRFMNLVQRVGLITSSGTK